MKILVGMMVFIAILFGIGNLLSFIGVSQLVICVLTLPIIVIAGAICVYIFERIDN